MRKAHWYNLELLEDPLISVASIYKSMQNKYLPYQNVQGEDSVIMCKAFIFGTKLLLKIRCTTHFHDTSTFIATQRVNELAV